MKAQLYAQSMQESDEADFKFALWSAFTLEMLVRAAVAAVSPALLADCQDWNNVLFGLGQSSKKTKFVPKSASVTELVTRVEALCPEFTREHASFCVTHFAHRNREVHTGAMAFDMAARSGWLPVYFATCQILLTAIGESLESLFGDEAAVRAREDIEAYEDKAAKAVQGTIDAHRVVWNQKSAEEQALARAQAETASLRHYGHRTPCPACGSVGLVFGKAAGVPRVTVVESELVERQTMKPEAFHCVACGLRINGYSKLLAAGLGDTFTSTVRHDAVEYFHPSEDHGYFDEDNNEYFTDP